MNGTMVEFRGIVIQKVPVRLRAAALDRERTLEFLRQSLA